MKKVQLKLLNLSLISVLCLLATPKINAAKNSCIRKVDKSQQLSTSAKSKEEGKKDEKLENLEFIHSEELSPKLQKFSSLRLSDFIISFPRAISFFDSGLSPPRT